MDDVMGFFTDGTEETAAEFSEATVDAPDADHTNSVVHDTDAGL
jgi:hypothetical protein